MENFLDFLTDNYIYFLIAAGVLTLALIGLLVSGRKNKKKEENINFEETPVDNNVTPIEVPPVVENTTVAETATTNVNITNEPVTPAAPQAQPVTPAETLNFNEPVETPVTPTPIVAENPTTFSNTVSIPPSEPTATVNEPIVELNPIENNTFEINQNPNDTTGNAQ